MSNLGVETIIIAVYK